MARHRGRHPKQGPWTPSTPSTPSQHPSQIGPEPVLVRSLRRSVEGGPVATLEAASSLVAAATLRTSATDTRHGANQTGPVGLAGLLDSFLEAPFPVMRVIATAMLPMLDDELLAHRVRHQLERARIPAAPPWLDDLEHPEPAGTLLMPDPLGDGENIFVSMTWRGGRAGTVMIYVDHNMGTIVKDAFVVPGGLEEARALWEGMAGDDLRIEPLSPADAKARIVEAIRASDRLDPPYETETWPGVRPLVEWWTSLLPDGGQGYRRRAVPAHEIEAIADRFVGSTQATDLDLPVDVVRSLVVPLLWFGSQSEPGDPLRWSGVAVEMALVGWLPVHIIATPEELEPLPDVLEALVRFAHHERGVAADHTLATIEAVGRWTPAFLQATAHRIGSEEYMRGRSLEPDDDWIAWAEWDAEHERDDDDWDLPLLPDGEFDFLGLIDRLERRLLDEIGGPEAVAKLDPDPLPDDPWDPTIVPDDLTDLIDDVIRRLDAVCASELDEEMATIGRRYLAALLKGDPTIFRRSARSDLTAAGLVWAAVTLQLHDRGRPLDETIPTQKRLAAAMGVAAGSMSNRAKTIRQALEERTDLTRRGPWHSMKRTDWIEALDHFRRRRAESLARPDDT